MVSSTLNMKLQELLKTLKRLRREFGDTPEYQKLRRKLPKEWPM